MVVAYVAKFHFRVGRTARAGKAGRSVAFVTQYDVEAYQRLEALIGQKLPQVFVLSTSIYIEVFIYFMCYFSILRKKRLFLFFSSE